MTYRNSYLIFYFLFWILIVLIFSYYYYLFRTFLYMSSDVYIYISVRFICKDIFQIVYGKLFVVFLLNIIYIFEVLFYGNGLEMISQVMIRFISSINFYIFSYCAVVGFALIKCHFMITVSFYYIAVYTSVLTFTLFLILLDSFCFLYFVVLIGQELFQHVHCINWLLLISHFISFI